MRICSATTSPPRPCAQSMETPRPRKDCAGQATATTSSSRWRCGACSASWRTSPSSPSPLRARRPQPMTAFGPVTADARDPRSSQALVSYIWEIGHFIGAGPRPWPPCWTLIDRGVVQIGGHGRRRGRPVRRPRRDGLPAHVAAQSMTGLEPFEEGTLVPGHSRRRQLPMGRASQHGEGQASRMDQGPRAVERDHERHTGEQRRFFDTTATAHGLLGATAASPRRWRAGRPPLFGGLLRSSWASRRRSIAILITTVSRVAEQPTPRPVRGHLALPQGLEPHCAESRGRRGPYRRHFLLAVVFGIADEVVEHLQVKVPEVVQDPAFRRGRG